MQIVDLKEWMRGGVESLPSDSREGKLIDRGGRQILSEFRVPCLLARILPSVIARTFLHCMLNIF